jgi:uncharacterized protein YjbK
MKLVNYKLLTLMESLRIGKSSKHFKEYLTQILEDELKPYYTKADYIGLTMNEMKLKIDTLSQNISELGDLKKRLTESLDMAKIITSDTFNSYGISRIDGSIVSSLTLTKSSSKTKKTLEILDKNAIMGLGYIKYELDLKAIDKAIATEEGLKELDNFIAISSDIIITPSKVKVNTKRTSSNTILETDEILDSSDEQTAA